ncbi:MAG: glycine cleavage system aminomethyltransferase GcvT [Candidatus Omnitrophica bacterium]|nr:glycine cleavage system aminomethyltransferase GcvT [Candidatus Omnitrophota bacterium]
MDLKLTPLFEKHRKLGARLAPFGGWLMPIQYTGIIAEHNWTRRSASIFDICHMGEFIIYGEPKKSNLERLLTIGLAGMSCGACRYGFMLNEKGGIIDDLIVYRIKQNEWMLVVNAAFTGRDESHLRKYLSCDSKLENISAKSGKIDLQGPISQDVLKELVGSEIDELKYYTFALFSILGEESIVSRTGYTGELGYEVYLSNEKIKELWNILLKDKRVKPAGLGARDTLRLEIGYPLYGQDINEDITPLEAGLERFVDFNKNFIGRDSLIEKKKRGITKMLVCFMTNTRRAPRHNYKIYDGDKEIGFVTSGSFSPTLSCGIGMGYVKSEYGKNGTKIILKENKIEINATVTDRPFYKKGSARS